jgi:hypothetical protein
MLGVGISNPPSRSTFPGGSELIVTGTASDRGLPEPITIEDVSVRIDDQPLKSAALWVERIGRGFRTHYSASITVPTQSGAHLVTAVARNDLGDTKEVSQTFWVEKGPMEAKFAGTATVRTSHPADTGSHASPVECQLIFDPDRVKVTLFPPVIPDPPEVNPFPETSVKFRIRMDSEPESGRYEMQAGALSIPVSVEVRVIIDVPGPFGDSDTTSKLELQLRSGEPEPGAYESVRVSAGSPVDQSGNVRLTGWGTFKEGALDGFQGSLVFDGTISPHP